MPDVLARRPQRADARRNYESLLEAARSVFADQGSAASLEEIARRADVGIGTLYRHFPTRRDLFESVYVSEVEALCRSAEDSAAMEPWDGLVAWLRRFVEYLATKRAVAEELSRGDTDLLMSCRAAVDGAGTPLLQRAQASGDARSDVDFHDVLPLVMGITLIDFPDRAHLERVLGIALDGVRAR